MSLMIMNMNYRLQMTQVVSMAALQGLSGYNQIVIFVDAFLRTTAI